MAPFRVIAAHPDPDHHGAAPASLGSPFDTLDDAEDFLKRVDELELEGSAPAPLEPEERVRLRTEARAGELVDLGYELRVEELVVTEEGTDDAGEPVATAHAWQEVSR